MTGKSEIEQYFEDTLAEFVKRQQDLIAVQEYMRFVEERKVNVHCDNRVLHSPGVCEYCDRFPEAQLYRKMLHLKFTDEMAEGDSLLPGQERTRASAERWGGNIGRKDGD